MRDCLLLVDVFDTFDHEDGPVLHACFNERFAGLRDLVRTFREGDDPIVYANDSSGVFDGDAAGVVEKARLGPAGSMVDQIAPRREDRFVLKPRYSAFDHTPLELILDQLAIERIFVAGMTTEGCVAQTAIDARELGYKVTVVTSACCTIDLEVEDIALAYLERVVGVRLAMTADRVGS
jgi:nicotinamidase-related amidase